MFAASSGSVRWAVGATLTVAFACGGVSARSGSGQDVAAGGGSGAPAGMGGAIIGAGAASGASGAGAGGAAVVDGGDSGASGTGEPDEPVCVLDDARCNAAFRREICGVEGWTETNFVCARTVAVDDEIGSYCVTKGDGSYRCWGTEAAVGDPADAGLATELPVDDYVRVQRAAFGLIGLNSAGRLVVPDLALPRDLAPVVAFRATNMWGSHGVCPRFADGSFAILRRESDLDGNDLGLQTDQTIGPVLSGGCFYEGFAAAVLADGSLWSVVLQPPPGNHFAEVTMSLRTFCALETNGGIACFEPYLGCMRPAGVEECRPRFPAGRYHSLTATYDAVCAIDEQGTILCRRFDGADMPVGGGPYVFAEGGRDVLCAIRRDGTTACFRQDSMDTADVSAFVSVEPPIEPEW